MKLNNVKSIFIQLVVIALIIVAPSCEIKDPGDLNGPSLSAIEADASIDEMNNLVFGMLSGMRNSFPTFLDDCGVIGRDYYRISGSDPRFTTDLLGKEESVLDNNTFYIVNPWASFYRVVRDGWILRHAVDNTTASLIEGQKNGYIGFAKTMQALEQLYCLNLTYENGIRLVDAVEDPNNLGAFTSGYDASLDGIISLLDDGYNNLNNSDSLFAFPLTTGFAGFDDRNGFKQFNRALAARVNLYRGNYSSVLTILDDSFFSIGGDINTGIWITYSTASGDVANDMFYQPNSSVGGNVRIVHPQFIDDSETGDTRVQDKTFLRIDTAFADGLTGTYDVYVWKSTSDPTCIIRNEELILIAAEARNETGDGIGALQAIDVIRASAGLGPYLGGTSQAELRTEILHQRRYSLFAEGHRWIDMRRTGNLGLLPIDRPGDDVWDRFPVPIDEGL